MLFYLMFWNILGFIFHFYIIFGTNLLTGGPAQNCCFFAYFSVSKKQNIKWSPNGMKPSGAVFLEQTSSRRLGVDVKQQRRRPRGCPARPPPSWAPRSSPTYVLRLYILFYPENIQGSHGTTLAPPQHSVPVRSHLGTFSSDLPEGDSITKGFYINT